MKRNTKASQPVHTTLLRPLLLLNNFRVERSSSFSNETRSTHTNQQLATNHQSPSRHHLNIMNTTMQTMNATAAVATTLLLREPLRVKVAKLFYKKTAVELVYLAARAAATAFASPSPVTMLSVKRITVFGGDISIPLDASIQPVRLVRSAKDAAKLTFSVVFGADNKTLRIRAPSVQAYDEWTRAIRLALNGAAVTVNKLAIVVTDSSSKTTTNKITHSCSITNTASCLDMCSKTSTSTSSTSISWCSSLVDTASDISDCSSECDSTVDDDDCSSATTTQRSLTLPRTASNCSRSSLVDEVELLLSAVGELDQWTSRARQQRLGL